MADEPKPNGSAASFGISFQELLRDTIKPLISEAVDEAVTTKVKPLINEAINPLREDIRELKNNVDAIVNGTEFYFNETEALKKRFDDLEKPVP